MKTYILNKLGQWRVTTFVIYYAESDFICVKSFFEDAERSANDAFEEGLTATIEISGQLSYDCSPHVLKLEKEWFDAREEQNV